MLVPLLAGLLLARPAFAQEADVSTAAVVQSTETAAGQSTETVKAVQRAIFVKIHREAAAWTPVSVREGGDPAALKNSVKRRLQEVKVKARGTVTGYKGDVSKAKAVARLHDVKGDRMLVVSVYPAALKAARQHFEVRYLIVEGFLEEVKIAAVRIGAGSPPAEDEKRDSFALNREGVAFEEESPRAAKVIVAAINAKPGKNSWNAGTIRGAAFGAADLGRVDLSYSVKGVSAP